MICKQNKFKICALLGTLTDSEAANIQKMLDSNFFTSRQHLIRLYGVLINTVNNSDAMMNLHSIFSKVYPTLTFDYGRLRKAMSDLLPFVEDGVLILMRKSDPIQSNLTLLELYRNRNLDKSYRNYLKKTEALIFQGELRNQDYFNYLSRLQSEKLKRLKDPRQIDHETLQSNADIEDILFLSKKLRLACAQLSYQLVHNHQYDFGLLDHLLDKIEDHGYLKIPAIAIYYYCFKFMSKPADPSFFKQYKSILNQHQSSFTIEDLSDSYRSAINYCIRKNNEGDHSFIKELWELYIYGLQKKILFVDNMIPRFTFNNALTAGLKLKEYSWAFDFIHEYSKYIESKNKAQTIAFNFGKLAFEQGDYQTALDHLSAVKFKEIGMNLVGNTILLKIYFELKEFDLLDSQISSFQQFIRRKEVSSYHRKNILNITSYVRRIISVAEYDEKEQNNLQQKIKQEEILTEREWLLSKLKST